MNGLAATSSLTCSFFQPRTKKRSLPNIGKEVIISDKERRTIDEGSVMVYEQRKTVDSAAA
jgi:hypothetical protein